MSHRPARRVSPTMIVDAARRAGFSPNKTVMGQPQDVMFTAIALAETSGDTNAHNANAATGDNSYGAWQINMLGSMGPERRRQFGISKNDELFDLNTNARAAYIVSNKGRNPIPWSVFNSGAYMRHIGTAQKAASGSTVTVIGGGATSSDNDDISSDLKEFGLRAAYFLLGGVAIIVSLLVLTGRSKTVREAIKQMPAGRVARSVT